MKVFKKNYPHFINKWLKLLDLTQEKIIIRCEENGDSIFEWDDITFDVENEAFLINIKYPPQKFSIIHELGHLYLAKELKDVRIIKNYEPLSKFMNMRALLYGIMDAFVNYKLCKFDEFYSYFIKKYPLNKIRMVPKEVFKIISFFEALDNYISIYFEFNFLLRKKDKFQRLNEKKLSLKKMRKDILDKSKEENIRFSFQDFQRLDKKLNSFDQIRESLTFTNLLNFMIDILKTLNFWKVSDIKEQFSFMFNL